MVVVEVITGHYRGTFAQGVVEIFWLRVSARVACFLKVLPRSSLSGAWSDSGRPRDNSFLKQQLLLNPGKPKI